MIHESRALHFEEYGRRADVVAERIDAEGAVLEENDPRHAGDEEGAERRAPAAPQPADGRRQDKARRTPPIYCT